MLLIAKLYKVKSCADENKCLKGFLFQETPVHSCAMLSKTGNMEHDGVGDVWYIAEWNLLPTFFTQVDCSFQKNF